MRIITTERIPIKVWSTDLDGGALQQAKNLANSKFAKKWVAVMADSHQGYGMPIGGVLATTDVIIPNAVGVDIGCGMVVAKTSLVELGTDDLKIIMGRIRKAIPVGFKHQREKQDWRDFDEAPDIEIVIKNLEASKNQLGTLGGGNHFIEIQEGNDGHIWVMIHSGSRNFGLKIASYYEKLAKKLCERWMSDITDPDLSFLPLDTIEGKEYCEAMKFAVDFAERNRTLMMQRVLDIMRNETGAVIEHWHDRVHNYATYEHHFGKNYVVHRKGATKASSGLEGIIPGSMGTHSYIVEGLGNAESFESCSHGAGRRLGRKAAIRGLNLEQEQERMSGIVHGLRNPNDLDEAPGAYKDIETVMADQSDLVKIKVQLTPLGVIKG